MCPGAETPTALHAEGLAQEPRELHLVDGVTQARLDQASCTWYSAVQSGRQSVRRRAT
jgi:hypothetical protein